MDPDVVLLSNIESLFTQPTDPNILFRWGETTQCAGFLLLNARTQNQILSLAKGIDLAKLIKTPLIEGPPHDQFILRAINLTYPEKVGFIPREWDISYADGGWRKKKVFLKKHPEIGMIHFNGGGRKMEAFFHDHPFLFEDVFKNTTGLANYYVNMPWTWAKYFAKNQIDTGEEGYALQVNHGYYEEEEDDNDGNNNKTMNSF
eukprot:scaffold288864_cov48-Attheya_sp.AAC.1